MHMSAYVSMYVCTSVYMTNVLSTKAGKLGMNLARSLNTDYHTHERVSVL